MACIDFCPEDYIDEIGTAELLAELQRRRAPALGKEPEAPADLVDLFRAAWDERDEAAFARLLLLVENPKVAARREAALQAAYEAARPRPMAGEAVR